MHVLAQYHSCHAFGLLGCGTTTVLLQVSVKSHNRKCVMDVIALFGVPC